MASVRSSFSDRARATVRARRLTSSVRQARAVVIPLRLQNTCVLCFNRRNDFECVILSMSR